MTLRLRQPLAGTSDPAKPFESFSFNRMLFTSYTYTWEVHSEDLPKGTSQRSSPFSTGVKIMRKWSVLFYPNGLENPENEDFYPFRVAVVRLKGALIQDFFRVGVLVTRRGDVAVYSSTVLCTHQVRDPECEEEFLLPNKAGRPFRCIDNRNPYTVRCRIYLPEEEIMTYVTRPGDLEVYSNNMMKMLRDEETKDFGLLTRDNESILIHRCILRARSLLYRSYMEFIDQVPPVYDDDEESQRIVPTLIPWRIDFDRVIPHYQTDLSKETLEQAIEYMYTGTLRIELTIPILLNLYDTGTDFCIAGLAEMALSTLLHKMTPDFALTVMRHAGTIPSRELLRSSTLIYIAKNFSSMDAYDQLRFRTEFSALEEDFEEIQRVLRARQQAENTYLLPKEP